MNSFQCFFKRNKIIGSVFNHTKDAYALLVGQIHEPGEGTAR